MTLDKEFLKKVEIVQKISKDASLFKYIDEKYKKDKELIVELLSRNAIVYKYFPKYLKDDTELTELAIKNHYAVFSQIGDSLKNNIEFVKKMLEQGANVELFNDVGDDVKDCKEIVLKYLIKRPNLIYLASKNILQDLDVAEAFTNKDPSLISNFTGDVLKNVKIAKKIVTYNGLLLKHFSTEIKKNKEIVKLAIKNNYKSLSYVSSVFTDNKKFMLEYLRENLNVLTYCSSRLKEDEDITKLSLDAWFEKENIYINSALFYSEIRNLNQDLISKTENIIYMINKASNTQIEMEKFNREMFALLNHRTKEKVRKILPQKTIKIGSKEIKENDFSDLKTYINLAIGKDELSFALPKIKEQKKIKI